MRSPNCPIATAILLISLGGCFTMQSNPSSLPEAMKIPEIQHAMEVRQSLEDEKCQIKSLGTELRRRFNFNRHSARCPLVFVVPRHYLARLKPPNTLRQSAKVILEKGPLYVEKINHLTGNGQTPQIAIWSRQGSSVRSPMKRLSPSLRKIIGKPR